MPVPFSSSPVDLQDRAPSDRGDGGISLLLGSYSGVQDSGNMEVQDPTPVQVQDRAPLEVQDRAPHPLQEVQYPTPHSAGRRRLPAPGRGNWPVRDVV